MATLKEIIYSVKNLKGGGIQSDDVKLSDANYADIINYYRAKLIRQEIDRGMRLDPSLIQPLDELEVERVEFNRNEPLSGRTVFRTTAKIPKAVSTTKNNLITFVGDSLLGSPFQRSTPYKVQLDIHRPFTAVIPKWFEFDERIYIVTEDPLDSIVVQLVAENPYKIAELNDLIDPFDPYNFEYPLSDTMRDSLLKLMIDVEIKIAANGTDDLNDGLDRTTQE